MVTRLRRKQHCMDLHQICTVVRSWSDLDLTYFGGWSASNPGSEICFQKDFITGFMSNS